MRQLGPECEGVVPRRLRASRDHLVRREQADIATRTHRASQRDVEIDNLDLMLDEGSAGLAVLPAPFDIRKVGTIAHDQ